MSDDESYGFGFDFPEEPARHVKRQPPRLYGPEEEALISAFLKAYFDDRCATVAST